MRPYWMLIVPLVAACAENPTAPGCDVVCDKLDACGQSAPGCESQCTNLYEQVQPAVQDPAEEPLFLCWADEIAVASCADLEGGVPAISADCWAESSGGCEPAREMGAFVDGVCDRAVACRAGTDHAECVDSFLTDAGTAAFPCWTAAFLDAIEACFIEDYCEDGAAFGDFVVQCAIQRL